MTRTALMILALCTLTACETAKGAGRDIQKAGKAISNAASDVQQSF